MRVVITGALGYVGSRVVCEAADLSPSIELLLIDDCSSANSAPLTRVPLGPRCTFVRGDVLHADLEALFAGADAVVHLAAITNGAGVDESAFMQQVNTEGTARVAHACIAANAALLFPSTTSVYGVSHDAIADDAPPEMLAPQNRYAATKLESEELIRSLGASHGLRFSIFRMGTIFGGSPGMAVHTAVNRFCAQALAGEPVDVWRTAIEQRRPYLDLSDAARAIHFALGRRLFDNRVYNAVTVNATVAKVAETLSAFVPDLRLSYIDSPLMNSLSYGVSPARLQSMGFEFTGGLAQGIASALAALADRPGLAIRRAG